jgi:hypothetical protein
MAVYFVQALDGGPIKIGTSVRISFRLKQLQKESGKRLWVLGVVDGDKDVEKELHGRFAHLRIAGEWFKPGPDLHEFITREAKDWDGVDEVKPPGDLVRIDPNTLHRVRIIAISHDISVPECLAKLLRRPIKTELGRLVRKINKQYGQPEPEEAGA